MKYILPFLSVLVFSVSLSAQPDKEDNVLQSLLNKVEEKSFPEPPRGPVAVTLNGYGEVFLEPSKVECDVFLWFREDTEEQVEEALEVTIGSVVQFIEKNYPQFELTVRPQEIEGSTASYGALGKPKYYRGTGRLKLLVEPDVDFKELQQSIGTMHSDYVFEKKPIVTQAQRDAQLQILLETATRDVQLKSAAIASALGRKDVVIQELVVEDHFWDDSGNYGDTDDRGVVKITANIQIE